MDGSAQAKRRHAFGPSRRLRRETAFREAFAGGHSVAGRYVVIWPRRGPGAAGRCGVIASRRTFRRAVDRARAKRLLREAFRLSQFSFRPDRDVVLVARRRILDVKMDVVREDLLRTATRCGVLVKVAGP